jgi:DNA-binding NtrC family response regulator
MTMRGNALQRGEGGAFAAVDEQAKGKPMAAEQQKINLLIVDDEEAFLKSMAKRLQVRDFNVIAVTRGEQAIEAAKANPIDIALVDLKMPGMNGEETLRALKRENEWMEVVILTGHGSVDSAVECTKLGAHSYLQKPCELESLLEVLAEAYKKRIMNKMKIQEKRLDELLALATASSPLAILRKIKELDREQ